MNAWPRSRGWAFDAEWKWTHADTGHTLNLNDDGHHGEDGYWQHMVSFVPFVARLPGAWFRPCFGWLAPGGCFPFFGLGWLWFLRLSSGLRLPCCVAVVCCGGSLLLPSAHVLSTWGQFMDKVMMRGPAGYLPHVLGHIASLQARLRQHEHDAKTSRLANGGKTWLLLMRRCHGGSRVRSTLLVLLWPALTTTLLKLMLRLPGSCLNTGKGFGISALLLVLLLSLGSSPCLRTFNRGRPSEQELRAIAALLVTARDPVVLMAGKGLSFLGLLLRFGSIFRC